MAELALDKVKFDEKSSSSVVGAGPDGSGEDSGTESDEDDDGKSSSAGTETKGKRATSPSPPEEEKPLHPRLFNVTAVLEMKNLWDEFNELGTEMIVTKVSDAMCHGKNENQYSFLSSTEKDSISPSFFYNSMVLKTIIRISGLIYMNSCDLDNNGWSFQ